MTATPNPTMGPVEWALLLTLSVLGGASFFFQKVALAELPPFTILLARVGFAALALGAFITIRGERMPRSPRVWGAFVVMGALNNLIPFSLILWGQTQIASGLASILNAMSPLFAAVLAHYLTRDERLTGNRLGGVLAGLAGVTVMIQGDALRGLGSGVLAQLAVLAAALSYAFAGIFGRRFADTPPLVTATGQLTATTVMMVPLALAVDRPWNLLPPGLVTWGALAALALPSTVGFYAIYFRLLARAGATNVLLVTLLMPVSTLLLGTAFLAERLEPNQFTGMALIALGLAAVDGRPLKWPGHILARSRHRNRQTGLAHLPDAVPDKPPIRQGGAS